MISIKITKSYPGLIVENASEPYADYEFTYLLNGDVLSNEELNIILDAPLVINGSLRVKGNLFAGHDIMAMNGVSVEQDLYSAGAVISSRKGITVGGILHCDGEIIAEEDLECGRSIVTEGYILTGGYIRAKDSIQAGCSISAKTYIQCGKRIFAGLCPNDTSENCDNVIRCAELRNGVLCYGILILHPEQKHN